MTWAAVVAEVVGVAVLGLAGLRIVRRQGYLLSPTPTPTPTPTPA